MRPDGKRLFSLARLQMAFWLFLVTSAYFLLFLMIDDIDTITSSVLVLMGISAGTALGAAVVDSGQNREKDPRQNLADVDLSKMPREIRVALQERLSRYLAQQQSLRDAAVAGDAAAQPGAGEKVTALGAEIDRIKRQLWFFGLRRWQVVMYDLLGDDGSIGFHRFQIFVWTIVLGIIFVARVYQNLAMPEFSSTLLEPMGISAGTYVGFKLPEAKI
jgi:hypothetical protein